LPPLKRPDIRLVAMSFSPSTLPHDKKKKKAKGHAPNDALAPPHPTSNTADDGGISQAIQNALDHARASEAIATSSNDLANSHGDQSATKSKKRRSANDAAPVAEGTEQSKPKKKKKRQDASVASTLPALVPPAGGHSNPAGASNMSQLAPAYIPPHMSQHIPIDPALTQNDQVAQPPHPHDSNSQFVDAGVGALQHQGTSNGDPYMFNQDAEMPMLGSNEDILHAFQGFDMSRFTGALSSLTSENTGPQSGDPGPSAPSTSQSSRPRGKKVVAPQPTGQVVNPEHADILATHWLNPAKLADLVKSQGMISRWVFLAGTDAK
jgi:hypothetical protein